MVPHRPIVLERHRLDADVNPPVTPAGDCGDDALEAGDHVARHVAQIDLAVGSLHLDRRLLARHLQPLFIEGLPLVERTVFLEPSRLNDNGATAVQVIGDAHDDALEPCVGVLDDLPEKLPSHTASRSSCRLFETKKNITQEIVFVNMISSFYSAGL